MSKDKEEILSELKPEHRIFAENYIFDWNATRAYKVAYPGVNDNVAAANGNRLLRNAKIQEYIEEIQKDLSKISGISQLRNLREFEKIAYSSLHNYHKDWFTLEEWENISNDDKAAISEISRTENKHGITIKFKLHDKQKALDSINKMLGFNAPERTESTVKHQFSDKTEDQLKDELNRLSGISDKT